MFGIGYPYDRGVDSYTTCPGCGDVLPEVDIPYNGYFQTSDECWGAFSEALARAVGNAALAWEGHQVLVDGYAVQHAGGPHPDKSVAIHLTGLHLVFERGIPPGRVAPLLQVLAGAVKRWPRLEPPRRTSATTASQIVRAPDARAALTLMKRLGEETWMSWEAHHDIARELADRAFGTLDPRD